MIIAAGEILVDVFPQYSRMGGAPFNFAYHAKHLGTDVRLITRVGADETGAEILSLLEKNGFDTRYIQVDEHRATGRVIVTPDQSGGHDFEILPDSAYDYIEFPEMVPDLAESGANGLVYFGTLAQRTPSGFSRVQAFLDRQKPETRRLYDINLRRGNFNDNTIRESLEKTTILKLNTEELEYLRNLFAIPGNDPVGLAQWLITRFGIELVSLTKGAAGSALITMESHAKIGGTDFEVVDTVGAGDAYAAMLATGLLRNMPFQEILTLAGEFSAAICRIKGAIPDDPLFYEPFLKQLPGAADA